MSIVRFLSLRLVVYVSGLALVRLLIHSFLGL